jgi:hypothetical protein
MEDKLQEAIFHEDHIGRVIKTHIHLEFLIIEYLKLSIPHYEYLKTLKLDYFGKIHLAVAMGLDKEYLSPLKFIGTLRNTFAHNLDQGLNKQTMNNFYDTFSKIHKKEILEITQNHQFSWIQDGITWKEASNDKKFMVLCLHLYYEIQIQLDKLNHLKNL